ncbi:transcription elongation factor GreA [Aquipuribacter nitratireducens]|uniref:Transcription elongation factor GreA n=1 Tax=Aquipuribacter nitratireducens TaxID=650104 RepID=A0ABW0GHZ2_9MICO
MSETSSVTWLTQEAHDRLQAELDHLRGEGRLELARKIEAAREEGDLKENGGYHAAKEEQGKQEARIRQLEQMLENAQVGAPEDIADDGAVHAGMVVTADVAGAEETFLLGSREIAATTDLDVFSEQSPLGAAVLGQPVGTETSYTAPNGRQIPVRILKAERFTG